MFSCRFSCLLLLSITTACNTTIPPKKQVYDIPAEPVVVTEKIEQPLVLSAPIVTAYDVGILVNGKDLQPGRTVAIAAGVTKFSYFGESTLSKAAEGSRKKDHRNIKTIACVALLPLCPAIMALNTEGIAPTITTLRQCVGEIDFKLEANARYIARIVEDATASLSLQIQEIEPNGQRSSSKPLVCETVD